MDRIAINMYNLAMQTSPQSRPPSASTKAEFSGRRILFGHSWTVPRKIRPAIVSVMDIQDPAQLPRRIIKHRLWAIECAVTPGQEMSFNKGKWRPLNPGSVNLYAPGIAYKERIDSKAGPVRIVFILFQGGELMNLNTLLPQKSRWVSFSDSSGEICAKMQQMALTSSTSGESTFWNAQAGLMEIIHLLLQSRATETGERSLDRIATKLPAADLVGKVKDYLAAHFAEPVTLSDLARHAAVSISSLAHNYRRLAGETPMQSLTRIRIQKATGLLRAGWLMKSVAAQTGFTDEFHLSKSFKKIHGCAPRKFLRQQR
jgi:AraC-like DNA-binding protein